MKKKVFSAFAAIFLLAAGLAASAQTITLTGVTPATLVYGGISTDNWIIGSFTITCTTTSNTATTTDIAPQQETYDRNNFTYINTGEIIQIDSDEIYKSKSIGSTPVKMWGADTSVSSSNFYLKTFSSGTHSQTFTYYLWFNHGSTLSAGTYQLPITIRTRKEAYSSKGPKTNPVAELPINLTFVVDPIAALVFRSSSGGSAISAIDFGDLSQAVPQSFVVNVNSNFRYSMNVSSLNGGNLVSGTYQIPYTMTLNGTQVPLTSAGTRALNYQAPNTGSGTDYNVTLAVVLPQALEFGSYSDSLTFTITAQ
jgi:hypothetical protein